MKFARLIPGLTAVTFVTVTARSAEPSVIRPAPQFDGTALLNDPMLRAVIEELGDALGMSADDVKKRTFDALASTQVANLIQLLQDNPGLDVEDDEDEVFDDKEGWETDLEEEL